MALGQLVVRLGLDATDYIQGMSRAEAEAQRMARTIANDIGEGIGKATLAFAALAAGSAAAFKLINDSVESIAGFQDLSEKIGDTAENLYSLKKASDVSGVSMDDVAKASIRLTAALSKTDEDGKGAAQAIKALGLDFQAFKNLSPVEQMDAVAKSLNGFEDGAGKTAVAVALLGKNGADLLPFFNDLADGSERQIRLSNEQIKAANDWSERMATLKSEFSAQAQVLVAELIPSVNEFITKIQETYRYVTSTSNGVNLLQVAFNGLQTVFKTIIVVAANVAFVIKGVAKEVNGLSLQYQAIKNLDFKSFNLIGDAMKNDARQARADLDKFEAAILNRSIPKDKSLPSNDKDTTRVSKPVIDIRGFAKKPKEQSQAKTKEEKPESDGYLQLIETANKYLLSVQQLTKEETFLAEIQQGKYKNLTVLQQESVRATLEQGDAMRAQIADNKALADQQAKNAADEKNRQNEFAAQIESIRQTMLTDVQKLEEEQAKLNDLMTRTEVPAQLDILKQKSEELKKKMVDLKNPISEWQKLAGDATKTLVDGLVNAIVQGKSLADVFKNVVKQLAAMILKALIFKALEIGLNSVAPGVGSAIFGGGKAVGGGVQQGTSYLVGEKGPELFTPSQSGKIKTNTDTFRPQSATATMGNVYNINAPGVSREEFMAGLNRSQQGAVSDMRENRLRRRA